MLFVVQVVVTVYQQYAVAGGYAEQGYESYYGRYADYPVGEFEGKYSAYKGEGEVYHYYSCLPQCAELLVEEHEDYQQGDE